MAALFKLAKNREAYSCEY